LRRETDDQRSGRLVCSTMRPATRSLPSQSGSTPTTAW
jgi:hypothetical protein